jgi:bifunctional non-homologous end joining protein LigD
MALEEYRRKRDFRKTSEPAGKAPATSKRAAAPLSFVVQKHAARRLHYDFRLELDGVLKSWAVPKGPSLDPAEKRLAVEVEDHPIEYGEFEGVIPQGEYGGGTVMLWDRGSWTPADPVPAEAYRNGMLKFALHGEKLRGNWMLVRLRGRKKQDERQHNWLLVKERDAAALPGSGDAVVADRPFSVASGRLLDGIAADRDRIWHSDPEAAAADPASAPRPARKSRGTPRLPGARRAPMPESVKPQLAVVAQRAPDGADWLHEIKYDGYRLLAHVARGKVRLATRSGLDWTGKFQELARHFTELPVETALIDGEVVQLAVDGTTSFSGLQEALSVGRTGGLSFFAFDLLYRDGWDLTGAALEDRKKALGEIVPREAQGVLRYSDHQIGQGPAVLRQACKLGLEGIVSKRREAPYHAGRDASWRKVKCANREEFAIVGFTDPEGGRIGLGALLLGYYDPSQTLRYAGRVGTGFNTVQLEEMRRRLGALSSTRPTVPLPKDAPHKGVHWVEPSLVAEIRFAGWTADTILRHASFVGLREDKDAREVVHDPKANPPMSAEEGNSKAEPAAPIVGERARDGSLIFAGVRLTHPERVLFADAALTKLDLAHYYAAIGDWALPHLAHRPLTLVRSPGGEGKKSFYQKHLGPGAPDALTRFEIEGEEGIKSAPVVENVAGLVALAQMDVLEIHPWGATIDNIETPDRVTFDLDPDAGLPWSRVTEAALAVREALSGIGLASFVKTTGGKGLHVVVPLVPKLGWEAVKAFSRWVAERLVELTPAQFTANQALRARQGRIYIDYLRNGRGATAVGAYSPRARPGAPVSTPLSWNEVEEGQRPDAFTVATLPSRLRSLDIDPWSEIGKLRQSLGAAVRRRVGI